MGKEEGFVKIYRSLIDDPIWLNSTPAQKAVLITLMCMVTWKPRKWDVLGKPITLKPGQCFTSLSEIALRAGDGVSREVVRKALARFETLGFSTHQRTQRGTLITIVKWRVYQLEEETENTAENTARTQREHSENTTINKKVRKKERKNNPLGGIIENYTSNPALISALEDWVESRKASRRATTKRAVEINLRKLDQWAAGDDAKKIAIIEETISLGLAAFVQPKEKAESKAKANEPKDMGIPC